MHKAIYATLIGAAIIAAPFAVFAQGTHYPQPYTYQYASGAPLEPPAYGTVTGKTDKAVPLASLDPAWSGGVNPGIDANGVSPSFEGPRPSSVH